MFKEEYCLNSNIIDGKTKPYIEGHRVIGRPELKDFMKVVFKIRGQEQFPKYGKSRAFVTKGFVHFATIDYKLEGVKDIELKKENMTDDEREDYEYFMERRESYLVNYYWSDLATAMTVSDAYHYSYKEVIEIDYLINTSHYKIGKKVFRTYAIPLYFYALYKFNWAEEDLFKILNRDLKDHVFRDTARIIIGQNKTLSDSCKLFALLQ